MPPAIPNGTPDPALEAQKELLSHAYSSGMAYLNVVFGIGYAGFFATWGFTKDALTYSTKLGSALLICVSLLSFILFEVYKSFYLSQSLLSLSRAISQPHNFHAPINAWRLETRSREIRMGRIWAVAFWITLITGVSAGFVLMSAFIHGLLING